MGHRRRLRDCHAAEGARIVIGDVNEALRSFANASSAVGKLRFVLT
jgi:hypothetical protein